MARKKPDDLNPPAPKRKTIDSIGQEQAENDINDDLFGNKREEHLRDKREREERRSHAIEVGKQSDVPALGVQSGTRLAPTGRYIAPKASDDPDVGHGPRKRLRHHKLTYYEYNNFIITTTNPRDNPYSDLGFQHRDRFAVPELFGNSGLSFMTIEQAYLYWQASVHEQCAVSKYHIFKKGARKHKVYPWVLADDILTTRWTNKFAKYVTEALLDYPDDPDTRGVGYEIRWGMWRALRSIVQQKVQQSPKASRVLLETSEKTLLFAGRDRRLMMGHANIHTIMRKAASWKTHDTKDTSWGWNWLGFAFSYTRFAMEREDHLIRKKILASRVEESEEQEPAVSETESEEGAFETMEIS